VRTISGREAVQITLRSLQSSAFRKRAAWSVNDDAARRWLGIHPADFPGNDDNYPDPT